MSRIGSLTLLAIVIAAGLAAPHVAARVQAAALPHPQLVCTGTGWSVVGHAWRVSSPHDFAKSGGTLVSRAIRVRAARLPGVQYWVAFDPDIVNTCAFMRVVSIEIGRNAHSGSYLVAISVSRLPLGAHNPVPVLPRPPGRCAALRRTPSMGKILVPPKLAAELRDFAWIRSNVSGLIVTSAWQTVRQNRYVTVFAGSPVGQRTLGAIEVILSNACAGQLGPTSVYTTNQHTGPLTLTGVHSTAISFVYRHSRGTLYVYGNGAHFSLHASK